MERTPKTVAAALRELADEIERSHYIVDVSIAMEFGQAEQPHSFMRQFIPDGRDTATIRITHQRKMHGASL